MTASPWEGYDRAPLRVGLALVAAASMALLVAQLWTLVPTLVSHPAAPGWLLAFGGSPLRLALASLVLLASLAAFARGTRPLLAGAVALLVMATLAEADAALRIGPQRNFFAPGLMMLGWIGGLAFARLAFRGARVDPHRDEALAEAGAVGMLAATYVNAVFSKVLSGGLLWGHGTGLRIMILEHRGMFGDDLTARYGRFIVETPGVAEALGTGTLLIQGSALLFLVHPTLRAVAATLLLGLHANIFVLTGIPYVENVLLVALVGYPWPRWLRRPPLATAPAEAPPRALAVPLGASALVLVAVAALLAPLRPYTTAHHDGRQAAQPVLDRFGPLVVGTPLTGDWRIKDLEAYDLRLRLTLTHPQHGDVGFRVTPSGGDEPPGPFDRPGIHLSYGDSGVPFAALEPAGRALGDRLEAAAGAGAVGEALGCWFEAAERRTDPVACGRSPN